MNEKTPRVDKTRWRADAKRILEDLRQFQDAITAKYGYEGFSPVVLQVNGIVEGKLVSLAFVAEDKCVVCSLIDDEGTVLDTKEFLHKE